MIRLVDILACGVRNNAGDFLANGTVAFFEPATTTLKAIYSDFEQTIPLPNPVVLDQIGRLDVYVKDRAKLVIHDSDGVFVREIASVGNVDSDIDVTEIDIIPGDGLVADESNEIALNLDNATLEAPGGELRVKNSGITQEKLAARPTAASAVGQLGEVVKSAPITSFSSQSLTMEDVTDSEIEVTTKGRPLKVYLEAIDATSDSYVRTDCTDSVTSFTGYVRFTLSGDADKVATYRQGMIVASASSAYKLDYPSCAYRHEFQLPAGTYTVKLQLAVNDVKARIALNNVRLAGFER